MGAGGPRGRTHLPAIWAGVASPSREHVQAAVEEAVLLPQLLKFKQGCAAKAEQVSRAQNSTLDALYQK